MSSIVERGQQLLAEEAAQRDAEARAAREAEALAELRLTAPAILDLLTGLAARLAQLEVEVADCKNMAMATRVRMPVRDEFGSILFVVDELRPPDWAIPVSTVEDLRAVTVGG